ncbi:MULTISPECIES: hypothetical protein [Paenibacillus]|uniref:Uncharacterized protein n=1 Tax=Paenibacillus violae TaxID=3077234 RepID=A0ABU3R9I6_9BACL|nr:MULTISPECIES: hypothetical protein [Paenibacillus]MDU0200929.1 hypothetical protein [Paenibacillus sp. PFR10]MEC0264787.1 hypothetical protein [Paenibacillus anseongense]
MKYIVDYQFTKPDQGVKINKGSIQIDIESDVESEIIEKAKEIVMEKEGATEVKVGLISPEC